MSFLEALAEPEIQAIFRYWCSKRRGRPVPRKADIDPVEIPHRLLPYVFIYERTPGGRFRCRLSGTGIGAAYGRDVTGKHLDEIVRRGNVAERSRLFSRVLESGLPIYYTGGLVVAGKEHISFARILLPIAKSDGTADHVFGLVVFKKLKETEDAALWAGATSGAPYRVVEATPADLDAE